MQRGEESIGGRAKLFFAFSFCFPLALSFFSSSFPLPPIFFFLVVASFFYFAHAERERGKKRVAYFGGTRTSAAIRRAAQVRPTWAQMAGRPGCKGIAWARCARRRVPPLDGLERGGRLERTHRWWWSEQREPGQRWWLAGMWARGAAVQDATIPGAVT